MTSVLHPCAGPSRRIPFHRYTDSGQAPRGVCVRALIVDDSLVMRKLVANAVREAGLELTELLEARNGVEALAALETAALAGKRVDLILCDIHMPTMNGVRFLSERNERQLAPEAQVAMITADPSDPILMEAELAGARSFISKPFTPAEVKSRVDALLRAAPAARETSRKDGAVA